MRWITLAFWILLCLATGLAGARATAPEIPGWYQTLVRPGIAPPNWLFGPVWTLLYILMGIAAWRVTLAPAGPLRSAAIVLFMVQLAFNLAWSWIFFHWHALGAAFVEVVVLWVLIGAATLLFARLSAAAAWLMAPYWAWVTFAALLNFEFWRLNSGALPRS